MLLALSGGRPVSLVDNCTHAVLSTCTSFFCLGAKVTRSTHCVVVSQQEVASGSHADAVFSCGVDCKTFFNCHSYLIATVR